MVDIYVVTFPNRKMYIGVTKEGVKKRRKRHYYEMSTGTKYKFHNALNKYTNKEFWKKIDTFNSPEEAYIAEMMLIDCFDTKSNGYNSTFGGEGRIGATASTETREKQSTSKLGKKGPARNSVWRENISIAKRGSKNPMSKLSDSDIECIIDMRNSGMYLKDISILFNVVDSCISNICRGKRWNG